VGGDVGVSVSDEGGVHEEPRGPAVAFVEVVDLDEPVVEQCGKLDG